MIGSDANKQNVARGCGCENMRGGTWICSVRERIINVNLLIVSLCYY